MAAQAHAPLNLARSADRSPTVLIAGIGIAGPVLAWWLLRNGFAVTLVEKGSAPRRGGYMIDLWGVGYDVAERMGLLDELRGVGYQIDELRFVNAQGRRIGGLQLQTVRAIMHGRFLSVLRDDLARILYERVCSNVELLLGDSIVAIEQRPDGAFVQFEQARARSFDLVVGADGVHSRVRELVFGSQQQYEVPMGCWAASFLVDHYPRRDERAYVSYSAPGFHVARCSLREGRTAFALVCASMESRSHDLRNLDSQKQLLCRLPDTGAWEVDEILERLRSATDPYFERVSQIRMPRWCKGRVALVGDACSCPSLIASQGPVLALAGAYLLAHELKVADAQHAALARYERQYKPFVTRKQFAARRIAGWLTPRTKLGLACRNTASNLLDNPAVLRRAVGRALLDSFELPRFGDDFQTGDTVSREERLI